MKFSIIKITGISLSIAMLLGLGKIIASEEKSRFEKLELFNKVLNLIETQYYREVDTEKLIHGAIRGMMNALDPHSAFLDKDVFEKMNEDTKGEFGGLGIEVTQKDGMIVVITPIDDTPAYRAGVKAGDKIVEINNESTLGLTLEETVEKMRGAPETKISIGIVRDGNDGIKSFDLVRKTIKVRPVKSEIIFDEYLYLRLTSFQKTSAESIIDSIISARKDVEKKKKKLNGIVFDLRSNPGGLLDEAVDVSSIFLKEGIVVSTEGRDPKTKEIRYVKKTGHKEVDIPLVVLINGSSASASEIVAGALKDNKRGLLLGSRSFGKGSVQSVAKIDELNGVKMTIAQYMTPSGKKIQAIGIEPDIKVDEYESNALSKVREEGQYIREADLRNHLTATIETPDEKKLREEGEKQDRVKRAQRAKELNKKPDDKKEIAKKSEPSDDFQVIQAVNYLKGMDVFKTLVH